MPDNNLTEHVEDGFGENSRVSFFNYVNFMSVLTLAISLCPYVTNLAKSMGFL